MSEPIQVHEPKSIRQAYDTIDDFCSIFGNDAKQLLNQLIKDAESNYVTAENPSEIIFLFEQLEKLTAAVFLIFKKGGKREAAILKGEYTKILDPSIFQTYTKYDEPLLAWQDFPRFLSAKEYKNPYKAFRRVCEFATEKKWKYIFHELRDFAFLKTSFSETGYKTNVIEVFLLLNKLIEAAHLIRVRTIIRKPTPTTVSDADTDTGETSNN